MALFRAGKTASAMSGRKMKTNVSGLTLVSAETLLAKECKLQSGLSLAKDTAQLSQSLLATDYPFGHSGPADGANFDCYSAVKGRTVNIHVNQVSTAYASTTNPGAIDISNTDITDFITAYNTAHGTDYVLVQARYTSEG